MLEFLVIALASQEPYVDIVEFCIKGWRSKAEMTSAL